MAILTNLGINGSLWVNLGIYIFVMLVLTFVLFGPYFKAYKERVERTFGRAQLAERYVLETQEMQTQYEAKARELSSQYKSAFDHARSLAMREYDQLVSAARQESRRMIDGAKSKITAEADKAKAALKSEVPFVGKVIAARLLGKDLVQ